jgi:hypothetical protein
MSPNFVKEEPAGDWDLGLAAPDFSAAFVERIVDVGNIMGGLPKLVECKALV